MKNPIEDRPDYGQIFAYILLNNKVQSNKITKALNKLKIVKPKKRGKTRSSFEAQKFNLNLKTRNNFSQKLKKLIEKDFLKASKPSYYQGKQVTYEANPEILFKNIFVEKEFMSCFFNEKIFELNMFDKKLIYNILYISIIIIQKVLVFDVNEPRKSTFTLRDIQKLIEVYVYMHYIFKHDEKLIIKLLNSEYHYKKDWKKLNEEIKKLKKTLK